MEKRTIEQMVAAAILEKATDSIEIEGVTYPICDANIATLVLVSELISTFPHVEAVPKEQRLYVALHYAKDFKEVCDLCAILILGAENLTEKRDVVEYKRFLGVFRHKVKREVVFDKKAALAKEISLHLKPSVIFNCIIQRLQDMEVGHFFSIITSLDEANILKPTREVEKD